MTPESMLEKRAEALALRSAFPEESPLKSWANRIGRLTVTHIRKTFRRPPQVLDVIFNDPACDVCGGQNC